VTTDVGRNEQRAVATRRGALPLCFKARCTAKFTKKKKKKKKCCRTVGAVTTLRHSQYPAQRAARLEYTTGHHYLCLFHLPYRPFALPTLHSLTIPDADNVFATANAFFCATLTHRGGRASRGASLLRWLEHQRVRLYATQRGRTAYLPCFYRSPPTYLIFHQFLVVDQRLATRGGRRRGLGDAWRSKLSSS